MTMFASILVGTMILTPEQGMEYIVPTTGGYNAIKLGEEAGVTQVMRTGNTTSIVSPSEPTTFILGDDPVEPAIPVDE